MKYCADCKHYSPARMYIPVPAARCLSPNTLMCIEHLVYGVQRYAHTCTDLRSTGICGPTAKFFEQKFSIFNFFKRTKNETN